MTITRSSKFLVQSVAVCFSLLCVGHVVGGWAFAAESSPVKQAAEQSAPRTTLSKSLSRSNPTRAFSWAASASNDLTGRLD